MAQSFRFVCDSCARKIEAWSDGNPYYLDKKGKKQYAHHPDHDNLARCIGNDSGHLCTACGHEFMVDSRAPRTRCPSCSSESIHDTYELDGQACPYCKKGRFHIDPDYLLIS